MLCSSHTSERTCHSKSGVSLSAELSPERAQHQGETRVQSQKLLSPARQDRGEVEGPQQGGHVPANPRALTGCWGKVEPLPVRGGVLQTYVSPLLLKEDMGLPSFPPRLEGVILSSLARGMYVSPEESPPTGQKSVWGPILQLPSTFPQER